MSIPFTRKAYYADYVRTKLQDLENSLRAMEYAINFPYFVYDIERRRQVYLYMLRERHFIEEAAAEEGWEGDLYKPQMPRDTRVGR